MPELKGLPLSTKIVRFLTSGIAATLLHGMIASIAVYGFGLGGTASNGVAFVIANGFSYLVNSIWSFEASVSAKSFMRFATVSLCGFAATLLISASVSRMGYPPPYSIAAVVILLPAFSFLAHNFWTFR